MGTPAPAPREVGWGLLALGQHQGQCLSVVMCHELCAVPWAAGHGLALHGLAGIELSWAQEQKHWVGLGLC